MILKKMAGACYSILLREKQEKKVMPKNFYENWTSAYEDCTGYDSEEIFNKVKNATLEVKSGKAMYERDGVLFYDTRKNYNLVSYINAYALRSNKEISVVDWGGALGSIFFQNKSVLPPDIIWTVIEQKHFVEFGKRELEDENLKFAYKLAEVAKTDIVLLSGVLQYLDFAYDLLNEIIERKPEYIILERTQFGSSFKIWKQVVPEHIYHADYPVCCFVEEEIDLIMEKGGYLKIDSWASLTDTDYKVKGDVIKYKSIVFKRAV